MLEFRPYEAQYKELCLAAFDSNTPKFFDTSERESYANYLDAYAHEYYWCVFQGEEMLGAGGYYLKPDGIARLVWGLIETTKHRQGFGRELLNFRLQEIAKHPDVHAIQLDTSQHNPRFFNRFGFVEKDYKPDFYGPGLHSYEMELELKPRRE